MRVLLIFFAILFLFGCAANDELVKTQRTVTYLSAELQTQREELIRAVSRLEKVEKILKEQEDRIIGERKEREREKEQIINLLIITDGLSEKMKTLLGKVDEIEHQLNTYWRETKEEISSIKKALTPPHPEKKLEKSYEEFYKEALEAYQKGNYEEAARMFSEFLKHHSDKPFAPNACYWLGESFMALKNYEKAILSFHEIIEKYGTSDFVPRAYLSQAEAFSLIGDKKSARTILKRLIELYPKSEEAKIAERRLKILLSD